MKLLIGFVSLTLLFFGSACACAEEAKPSVSSGQRDAGGTAVESETVEFESKAIVYQGNLSILPCRLFISIIEPEHVEGEDHVDHDVQVVAKMEVLVHGVSVVDAVYDFKRYSSSTARYFDFESLEPRTSPVLVSALLHDQEQTADLNRLVEYEADLSLLQWSRIHFFELNQGEFLEALERVIEGEATVTEHQEIFNQIETVDLKIWHAGPAHYDPATCVNMQLQAETQNKTFVLGAEPEEDEDHNHGDDDDHDHGDDDDHDHGGEHDDDDHDHDHDHGDGDDDDDDDDDHDDDHDHSHN